jgi:hypothetical protein
MPMGGIERQNSHGGAKEKSHLDLPPNEILQILVLLSTSSMEI